MMALFCKIWMCLKVTPHAYEAYNEVLPIDAAAADAVAHAHIAHHVSQDTAANLETSGVPPHRLHLHAGTRVHLLTNIDPSSALCTLTTQTGCFPALTLTSTSKTFSSQSAATSSPWLLLSLPPLMASKVPTCIACSSTSATLSSLTGSWMLTLVKDRPQVRSLVSDKYIAPSVE
jgi:hypothetical protein